MGAPVDILIVDDDAKLQDVVGACLRARGHSVRAASTVMEGLGLLEERLPGLVICDAHMPGTDGLELIRAVRSRFSSVPVVMVTADRDLDRAVAAFRLGAFDYLKKPIRAEELLDCVARAEEPTKARHGKKHAAEDR